MGQGWHGKSLVQRGQVTGRSDRTGQIPGPRRGELGFGVSALLRRDWAPPPPAGSPHPAAPARESPAPSSPLAAGPERESEGARARNGRCGVRWSQRGCSRNAEASSGRAGKGEQGQSPGSWECPGQPLPPPCGFGPGAALGGGEAGAASPPPRPAPSQHPPSPAGAGRNWSERQTPPPPHTPGPGDARWGKVCPVLTEDAVFLQGAVDLAVGVDLEVVLGGTVEFPTPGRSPEVLVDAAAAPSIPTRPGVARGGSGCPGHPRGPPCWPGLLQRTQEQDPNYNHCGMMAAALSLLGSWRLGASGTRGPIKAVLLAALQSCRAHTVSSREALASFYQPRSGPFICLRFT